MDYPTYMKCSINVIQCVCIYFLYMYVDVSMHEKGVNWPSPI